MYMIAVRYCLGFGSGAARSADAACVSLAATGSASSRGIRLLFGPARRGGCAMS